METVFVVKVPGELLQRVQPGGVHHHRPHDRLQLAGHRQDDRAEAAPQATQQTGARE